MMQISEFSFPHLHEAHEGRLTVELERRRVAAERRAEADATASGAMTVRRGIRARWAARSRTAPLIARGPANDPCPTCP